MQKLKIFENFNIIPKAVFESGIGTPNERDFINAINNRNYITFYYSRDDDGVLPGPRFVEPYCYGCRLLSSGETRYYLRAYMINNTSRDYHIGKKLNGTKIRSKSKSGGQNKKGGWSKKSGWRLYRIDSITNLYDMGKRFSYYRKGYNGSTDVQIPNIIAQCDKSAFRGEVEAEGVS